MGSKVECLGFARLDAARNEGVNEVEGVVLDVGVAGSGKKLLVCRTDEQVRCASDLGNILTDDLF